MGQWNDWGLASPHLHVMSFLCIWNSIISSQHLFQKNWFIFTLPYISHPTKLLQIDWKTSEGVAARAHLSS